MPFFYELDRGCCGCTIRSTVYLALFHFMVHGLFVVSFVFSNSCYPPFYYTDFLFGSSGAALLVLSFLATFVASLENLQWLRTTFGVLLFVTVMLIIVSTYIYTFERWNDVISTALTRSFRRPVERDFPDYFWYTLVVASCIVCSIFLIYLVFVMSYLCNTYHSPLLGDIYQTTVITGTPSRVLTLPADTYSGKQYKPYPVQQPENK